MASSLSIYSNVLCAKSETLKQSNTLVVYRGIAWGHETKIRIVLFGVCFSFSFFLCCKSKEKDTKLELILSCNAAKLCSMCER